VTEMAQDPDAGSSARIAGYLASMAIVVALIGIAWHPLRLIVPAMIVSLIAAGMAPRGNRLAFAAVLICAGAFFLGMLVSVVSEHTLW
jgi:hypothetical protein